MATKRQQQIPTSEWIVGGLGALMALAAIIYLVYDGVSGDQSPPLITVKVEAVEPVNTGYRARIMARNEGGEAAARVRIVGRLTANGETETNETVLDYLPAHSERGGGLFFRQDPRAGDLELRATGYEDP